MKQLIKVAVIQTKVPTSFSDAESHIERLLSEIVKTPVDIVGLPEDCLANFNEVKDGYDPFNFLTKTAIKYNVYLFGANITKEHDDNFYNTGFIINKKGEIILKHHKVVLTPFSKLTPGNSLEVVDTELGRLSLLVCKDAFHKYSAWSFNMLRNAGVELVLIPSLSINVTNSKIDINLWVDSLKALYKWFFMPIAASGTIGVNDTPYPSFGNALIIGNGEEMVIGSEDKEEVLHLTIDRSKLSDTRKTIEEKWQPKEPPTIELKILNSTIT